MSVDIDPPISLHEIRNNFKKPADEKIGSTSEYARDFVALEDGEVFDLMSYSGAAFGLQKRFMSRKAGEPYWQRHGSIYEMGLDESDRRADYDVDFDRSDSQVWTAPNGEKSIAMKMYQRGYNAGAVGTNGWWYAEDVGPNNVYECSWVLESGPYVAEDEELWGMLFGYRHGYLDGTRVEYSIQRVVNPEPNTQYPWSDTFTVDKNYRHCLQNFSIWMKGNGPNVKTNAYFHSCKIKRKP